jgi:hypothetical protein
MHSASSRIVEIDLMSYKDTRISLIELSELYFSITLNNIQSAVQLWTCSLDPAGFRYSGTGSF